MQKPYLGHWHATLLKGHGNNVTSLMLYRFGKANSNLVLKHSLPQSLFQLGMVFVALTDLALPILGINSRSIFFL